MPRVGSAVTFIVAHRVSNEAGGDDEQFTIPEMSVMCGVRGIVDAPRVSETMVGAV